MLEPVLSKLADKSIILASGSPRRHHLLNLIGLKFKAIPSNFEENLDKNLFALPSDYVKETAKQKAKEVASNLLEKGTRADLIIGADTVVVLGDQILEKPADERHAAQMLASLSSRSHYVCTGITLITDIEKESMNIVQFHEKTEVIMGELSHEVIEAYVKTGEPMDKAGSFGIQGRGSTLVKEIHGDYFNVMGFPLYSFSQHLLQLLK